MAQRRSRRKMPEYDAARDLNMDSAAYRKKEAVRTRRRKRRRFTNLLGILIVLGLCLLIGGGYLYKKYSPSKEMKDLNEWFEVSGN